MRYTLHTLLSALALGTLVSACALDEIEVPAEELYMREFVKSFGVIDKDHDWSVVERGTITVNSPVATRVDIMTYDGDHMTLVGRYDDVQGTRELASTAFPAPKMCTCAPPTTLPKCLWEERSASQRQPRAPLTVPTWCRGSRG